MTATTGLQRVAFSWTDNIVGGLGRGFRELEVDLVSGKATLSGNDSVFGLRHDFANDVAGGNTSYLRDQIDQSGIANLPQDRDIRITPSTDRNRIVTIALLDSEGGVQKLWTGLNNEPDPSPIVDVINAAKAFPRWAQHTPIS